MLLIAIAAVGAVGVFVAVYGYVSSVRSELGDPVEVVVSTEDLPPLATPTDESVTTVEMPERWVPPNVLRSPAEVADRVAAATIPADTVLSEGMLMDRPELEPGERELAILVDAETGVGGKLTTGSVVDIFAAFGGGQEVVDQGGAPPSSRIVVQRAEVIEVGSPVDVAEGEAGPGSVGFGSGQQLPVTFRLTVEDANRLVYVESFATSLRLALRSPLDRDLLTDPSQSIFAAVDELGHDFDPVDDPRDELPDEAADAEGDDEPPPELEDVEPEPEEPEDDGDDEEEEEEDEDDEDDE